MTDPLTKDLNAALALAENSGGNAVAKGFAAVQGDIIIVNSISEHERAAMVNWLVVCGGMMVPAGMGDFAIREHFDRIAKPLNVKVERVNIEVA